MLFCVVEFHESNLIDIVPSNWLFPFDDDVSQATAAYWPPFKDQLKIVERLEIVRNHQLIGKFLWSANLLHQVIISTAVNT